MSLPLRPLLLLLLLLLLVPLLLLLLLALEVWPPDGWNQAAGAGAAVVAVRDATGADGEAGFRGAGLGGALTAVWLVRDIVAGGDPVGLVAARAASGELDRGSETGWI